MSLTTTVQRIAELQTLLSGAPPPPSPPTPTSPTAFATALQSAIAAPTAANTIAGASGGGPAGQRIVALAQAEVGQAEMPPGSNDSPRIAQYRTATAGSAVAPWCGYFVSWVAQQTGVPIGERGEGMGSVDAIWDWGQRTGRALPAGGAAPNPGDLIVWDEHIGIVESVLPDGRIQTIEGNSSDQVSRRVHPPGDAVGYVRLG